MKRPDVILHSHKSKCNPKTSRPGVLVPVEIRSFLPSDLDTILEIQSACKVSASWGARDYRRLAADSRGMILVAELKGRVPQKVLGFSAFYRVDEEAELWNIAITPRYRRQGIAKSLLAEAFLRLSDSGAKTLFLEVRASNTPAMELYHSVGFNLAARRREYYHNPREDALVLVKRLALESEH